MLVLFHATAVKHHASPHADFGQVVGVISNLDDDEKGVITNGTLGGKQITHEVIHAIRKTDSYIARHSLPAFPWAEPLSRRKRGWRAHRASISVRGVG